MLSIAVVRNGEVVKVKGYGLANVELNVPASAETIYQSGSIGKQFTATAVMMLVEGASFALDDPITKYFPDAPGSWKNITCGICSRTPRAPLTIRRTLISVATTPRTNCSEAREAIPLAFRPARSGATAISGTYCWAF